MANFALIGAAGYVAPKHMKAIKEVGGNLVACVDPHDSVGILDSYFPECFYFNSWERFDRFCSGDKIDYVSICSPNYLHETHARWAMKLGADVICEKPLALYKRNLDSLIVTEQETGKKVSVILQLRLMEQLKELKKSIPGGDVLLRYTTPRGNWYNWSWKGDETKSGGLATNIGIHLFDVVTWLFGAVEDIHLTHKSTTTVAGELRLARANVDFILSINGSVPERTMRINGQLVDFNHNFTNLHTESYKQILAGNGFSIEDALPSIVICEKIRSMELG